MLCSFPRLEVVFSVTRTEMLRWIMRAGACVWVVLLLMGIDNALVLNRPNQPLMENDGLTFPDPHLGELAQLVRLEPNLSVQAGRWPSLTIVKKSGIVRRIYCASATTEISSQIVLEARSGPGRNTLSTLSHHPSIHRQDRLQLAKGDA